MKDVKCPYCNEWIEINHDDGYGYNESDTFEQECHHCDKIFVYTTSVHFNYKTYQAPCKNGGKHDWKKTDTFPPEFTRLRCMICGDERPII